MLRDAFRLMCLLTGFGVADGAWASTANFGYVDTVYGTLSGAILFNTAGPRTAAPSCQGASVPQRFALDTSTVAGQAQAKILLNAVAQSQRIMIVGTGTCSIWGDSETVNYFQVESGDSVSASYNKAGHITGTFLSGGGNYAFRVSLDSGLPQCTNGFAYVNKSFDNYQAYVSSLMSAFYSQRTVTLTYGLDATGYCQIVEFNVS